MNVNFVYSDFSDNGRALPNCSAQHPNFHWFDSTNFFSSYLNDDENNFRYWEDTEKFNIVKHKLNSVISNPTEPFFFMISHPGLCYNEMVGIIAAASFTPFFVPLTVFIFLSPRVGLR